MQAGWNDQTDCVNQRDDITIIGKRLGTVLLRDSACVFGIGINHGNQVAIGAGGVFISMPFAEMTDTDNSNLE